MLAKQGIVMVKGKFIAKLLLLLISFKALANSLEDLDVKHDNSGNLQLVLTFSEKAVTPNTFATDAPAKLLFDFDNVTNNLAVVKANQKLGIANVNSLKVLGNQNKTRLTLQTTGLLPFAISQTEKQVYIDFNLNNLTTSDNIKDFNFSRRADGAGRLTLDLADSKVAVDVTQSKDKVRVKFKGAKVPEKLLKTYDVKDFGTAIEKFSGTIINGDFVVDITTLGDYRKSVYQIDNKLVIDIISSKLAANESQEQEFKYVGEKITLSYQDIPVRFALEQLAEFADINVVISDKVDGDITIRLEDLPWDQALDLILQAKGLSKRAEGNVVVVGTLEDLAHQELLELENKEKQQTLEPLVSELFQLNYISAKEFVKFISGDAGTTNQVKNPNEKETAESIEKRNGILSWRGTYIAEDRTNTVLVSDIKSVILEVKNLINRVDIPVKQVEIATHIVEVNDSSDSTFGVTLAGGARADLDGTAIGIGNSILRAFNNAEDTVGIGGKEGIYNFFSLGSKSDGTGLTGEANADSNLLPALGIAISKLPGGTILDLELSALESENKSTTLAKPKITTLDKVKATLEHGEDIPYLVSAGENKTTYEFKKASLLVDVTPYISPNNKIKLELSIRHDSPAQSSGAPKINTKHFTTSIAVDNGETIVIGGLFTTNKGKTYRRIPFFSKLPLIGRFFKSEVTNDNRNELLIFVTPKIIEDRKPLLKD